MLAERQQTERSVLLGGRPQLVERGPVGEHVPVVAEVGVGGTGPGAQSPLERLDVGPVTSSRLGQALSGPGGGLRPQRGEGAVSGAHLAA